MLDLISIPYVGSCGYLVQPSAIGANAFGFWSGYSMLYVVSCASAPPVHRIPEGVHLTLIGGLLEQGLKGLRGRYRASSRAPCSCPGPGSSSLGEDAVNNAIVRLIVDFAHTLGLTVTAEGVENDRQVASLMAMRCDMIQGFHFSRPLGGEAARALVATNPWWQIPR